MVFILPKPVKYAFDLVLLRDVLLQLLRNGRTHVSVYDRLELSSQISETRLLHPTEEMAEDALLQLVVGVEPEQIPDQEHAVKKKPKPQPSGTKHIADERNERVACGDGAVEIEYSNNSLVHPLKINNQEKGKYPPDDTCPHKTVVYDGARRTGTLVEDNHQLQEARQATDNPYRCKVNLGCSEPRSHFIGYRVHDVANQCNGCHDSHDDADEIYIISRDTLAHDLAFFDVQQDIVIALA